MRVPGSLHRAGSVRTTAVTDAGDREAREAREAQRQAWFLRLAMRSTWPELARSDLTFGRYWVTHEPTGDKYRGFNGEPDAIHTPIAAYFIRADGTVGFLEAVS